MGMFTELGVLYAKYKVDKLMEHIKLFHKRINAHGQPAPPCPPPGRGRDWIARVRTEARMSLRATVRVKVRCPVGCGRPLVTRIPVTSLRHFVVNLKTS